MTIIINSITSYTIIIPKRVFEITTNKLMIILSKVENYIGVYVYRKYNI